jgi:hypothetical protein
MNETNSPQEKIENFMAEVVKLGNYETAYLLSEEGLALAHNLADEVVPEERLVEMSVLFQDIQKMADVMGGIDEINELIIEGHNKRKIIFRFFNAFDQHVILALIVPPQKTYRGLTNRLVRLIQTVSD